MPLETGTYIDSLNASNPVGASDPKSQGDDHLRLIKSTIKNTFPNIAGAMTLTQTQLNSAAIKTESSVFTGNVLGVQGTAPELRIIETDAAVDNGKWIMTGTGESLVLRAYNDALNSSQNIMAVTRTGTSVDLIRFYNGAGLDRLQVRDTGIVRLLGDGNTDTERRTLEFAYQNSTVRGLVGFVADGALRMLNQVHGQTVLIQGEDAGGVTRNIISADPDGETSLYYNGTLRAQAGSGLWRIRSDASPGIGSSQNIYYLIEQADGVDLAQIGFVSSSALAMISRNHGANIQLIGEDNSGVQKTCYNADPDGAVNLYYAGDSVFNTHSSGFDVTDPDGDFPFIGFKNQSSTRYGFVQFTSSQMLIHSELHGSPINIVGENAGGTDQTIITGDPDGNVDIYSCAVNAVGLRLTDYTATGQTSAGRIRDHGGAFQDVGFNLLPTFNDDTSDTLEAQHCGKINTMDGVTNRTLTLEANTSTDFPVDGVTHIENGSAANNYNVDEGTGTTLYYLEPGAGLVDTTGGAVVGPGGSATIRRISASVYHIMGSEITYTP